MSDYIKQLESRNEQLTSNLEKLSKELEAANKKIYDLEHPMRKFNANFSMETIKDFDMSAGDNLVDVIIADPDVIAAVEEMKKNGTI